MSMNFASWRKRDGERSLFHWLPGGPDRYGAACGFRVPASGRQFASAKDAMLSQKMCSRCEMAYMSRGSNSG